ncbi:MAG: 2-hydroxychromene-2-carboxylate isomerase [Deltaproteobacteria bacterium]|nr:2-hydroxychromene-2-carboxylate isomerase [Deltaproteobacteria bacterium]
MTRAVEVFYDVVCPYAYLGVTQIEAVAARTNAEVVWKPFLLGGVLNALGNSDPNAAMSVPKARHNVLDMHRWAEHFGVPLEMPDSHPRRTVLAMRALLAAGDAGRLVATKALFDSYWVLGEDVADGVVVARSLTRAGLDGDDCVGRAGDPLIKAELRERTDEALSRGVFGAPSFFVGDEMFWGQDRLFFVERALSL